MITISKIILIILILCLYIGIIKVLSLYKKDKDDLEYRILILEKRLAKLERIKK